MISEDDIITGIIQREGPEYTNRPDDLGGPTKYGVTIETLSDYLGQQATAADVAALTEDLARTIYRTMFIERPGFLEIRDDGLRVAAIDWGVNSGPAAAIKALQRLLGLSAVDGRLGPATLASINSAADPRALMRMLCRERALFIARLCKAKPQQVANLEGWTGRIWSFVL